MCWMAAQRPRILGTTNRRAWSHSWVHLLLLASPLAWAPQWILITAMNSPRTLRLAMSGWTLCFGVAQPLRMPCPGSKTDMPTSQRNDSLDTTPQSWQLRLVPGNPCTQSAFPNSTTLWKLRQQQEHPLIRKPYRYNCQTLPECFQDHF